MSSALSAWINFSISPAYEDRYPGVAFGLTLVEGCGPLIDSEPFDQYKRKLLRKMRKRETLARISRGIDTYDRFFRSFGYECPLPQHLKRTINSGFPMYNLMVDAHFLAEMCAGILVAVADYDRVEGDLLLDVASAGEETAGMGGRRFTTKEGEIVLRDEKALSACSARVRMRRQGCGTIPPMPFFTPMQFRYRCALLKEGLAVAAETMAEFAHGSVKGLEVFVRPLK